jgi:hypothetical protein
MDGFEEKKIDEFCIDDFALPNEPESKVLKSDDKIKRSKEPIQKMPKNWHDGRFVKGPIPAGMVRQANLAGKGKALGVLVVLFHIAGIQDKRIVKLSSERMREFGIDRCAGYRGLADLERVGLVKVQRHKGRCPIVELIFPKSSD